MEVNKAKKKIVKLKWGKSYGSADYSPKIFFKDMHERYGRAEFDICPVFRYGKLKKVFIYPRQQETDVRCYELEAQNQTIFSISSWTYKGFEPPNIWLQSWCKEHKTICHKVYVPRGTNVLSFDSLSNFQIKFDKEENGNA